MPSVGGLTISNQFTALPDHHPVAVDGRLTQSVSLYHWSWTYLLTQVKRGVEEEPEGRPGTHG